MRKKLMLLASTLSLQLLPLLSCGVVASKETIDESKLKVDIPYPDYSSSYKAISEIVEAYNRYVVERNKEGADLIPATVVNWATSYQEDTNRILNLLQSGTITELPSVTWNYASLASIAASYDRALELTSFDPKSVAPGFRAVNTQIQGLNPNKIWALNTGSSGQVNGINAPFLAYVVNSFLKVGAKISKDADQQSFFKDILAAGKADARVLAKVLGPLTKDTATLAKIKDFTFDTKRWENMDELLAFAGLVKDAFPSYEGYVAGFDDPNYLVFSLLNSALGFDSSKLPIRVLPKDKDDKDNQAVDLDNLLNPNSEANKILRGYFDTFKRYMDKRALWFPPRDRMWGSEFLKVHNLLFSIGSTAGYEYCYVANDLLGYNTPILDKDFYVPSAIVVKDIKANRGLLAKLNIDGFTNLESEVLPPNQLGYIVHNNEKGNPIIARVYISSGDTLSLPKGAAKSDIAVSEEAAKLLSPLLDSGATLAYDSGKRASALRAEVVKKAQEFDVVGLTDKDKLFTKKRSFISLKQPLEVLRQDSTLQAAELFAVQPPRRFSASVPHRTAYFQGPVVLGIKVTDKLDRNTLEFIKFYSSNRDWVRVDRKTGEETKMTIPPSDYFALAANYVYNSTELLSGPVPAEKAENSYYKVTFNEFKLGALGNDSRFKVYRVPDSLSLNTLWTVMKYGIPKLTQSGYDFNAYLEELNTQLGRNRR